MIKNPGTTKKASRGFTPVDHRMLEAWSLSSFFNNTARVYFVILRLTLGYHREWSKISREDFQEKTGIHNDLITRSLQRLDQCKIIRRKGHTKNVNYKVNQYVTTWKTFETTLKGKKSVQKVIQCPTKRSYKQKDSSYSMFLKKKKERKKPFSFLDLEKSKDQIERDFFEIFKDYPKKTNCKKALEIFRAVVKDSGELDKIKIALEHYRKKKKKPDSIFHGLGNWMKIWKDFYDMGKLDAERKKAAEEKQRKADIEAAAERKRIKNLPAPSKDVLDKIKRKNMPGTNWSARPKKKGG